MLRCEKWGKIRGKPRKVEKRILIREQNWGAQREEDLHLQ